MITVDYANNRDVDVLVYNPELSDRITDDYCPALKDFEMQYHNSVFIGGYIEGKIASLFIVHMDQTMHFMVLPCYRMRARELLNESLKLWPYDVYCIIPVLYKPVINFARKMGFKEVARLPDDHLKNGVYYDSFKLERKYGHY